MHWSQHAHAKASIWDQQLALEWYALAFGVPCSPQGVDGDWKELSRSALQRFRQGGTASTVESSLPDDCLSQHDWAEIAKGADRVVRRILGWSEAQLQEARLNLQFWDVPYFGAGEHWQRPKTIVHEHVSPRRVEILFADTKDTLPDFGTPAGKDIYANERYKWIPIEVEDRLRDAVVSLRLHDRNARVLANTRYFAYLDSGEQSGYSDDQGLVEIKLPAICPEKIKLRWTSLADHSLYEREIYPRCIPNAEVQQLRACLMNLGYENDDLDQALRDFQRDYHVDDLPTPKGRLPDQSLPPATEAILASIFGNLRGVATRPQDLTLDDTQP